VVVAQDAQAHEQPNLVEKYNDFFGIALIACLVSKLKMTINSYSQLNLHTT